VNLVDERVGDDPISSRARILSRLVDFTVQDRPVLVCVAKLDRLKSFNHAHGVARGDQFINAIGDRMVQVVGAADRVGKLRGDVFMMLVEPGDATPAVAAEALCNALNLPLRVADTSVEPGLKVGVALASATEADVDRLLIEASAAMRAARSSRTTDVVMADRSIRSDVHTISAIERDVEQAMATGDLGFSYQPIVTLKDNVVHGAEALLRWDHPELGQLDPNLVVRRIDAIGLLERFTTWSIDQVASDWASAIKPGSGLEGASVSINVNDAQIANPTFTSALMKAHETYGLDRSSLVLEVVESRPIGQGNGAALALQQLADSGSLVVLDDFGTGFNALEYFLQFPIHGIKFDRSLIAAMQTNEKANVIVRGVAKIADELGVATAGEGIEGPSVAKWCKDVPLTFGQGWHFGRADSIEAFVRHATASREAIQPSQVHRKTFAVEPPSGD